MNRIPVAVLGATGTVGQKFISLLDGHPWFEVTELVASERSAGKAYRDAVRWKQDRPIPERVGALAVRSLESDLQAALLFSGLDSSVAGEAEERYAAAGKVVISNARNHRMGTNVPLVIPEVNADHLALIDAQPWPGAIVTNSNCSTMFLAMALAPLYRTWGIEWVQVVTLQAISGAGYPGVASLDILGNVVPYIGGEEDKLETEPQKILGSLTGDRIEHAPFTVSAACTRVPVFDGHTEAVTVRLAGGATPSMEAVREALERFRGLPQERSLPSAPSQPIIVMDEPDRPQPARDVWRAGGMATLVGRLRPDPIGSLRMVVMGHNTVRGAAGAAIINAETMYVLGQLQRWTGVPPQ